MRFLPIGRPQQIMLLLFLIYFFIIFASSIYFTYQDFHADLLELKSALWQHLPTIIGTIIVVAITSRVHISSFNVAMIVVFGSLHNIGAYYSYLWVPYDYFAKNYLGFEFNHLFGITGNRYDRFIHFCYGLLVVGMLYEINSTYRKMSILGALFLSIGMIVTTSALFEIIEYTVAVTNDPLIGERFTAMQGDPLDPIKDMALALMGASFTATILSIRRFMRARRQ